MLHQRPRVVPPALDRSELPLVEPAPILPELPMHRRFAWDPFAPGAGS